MPLMRTPRVTFLSFPREIRDQVYLYYFSDERGFHFHRPSKRLRRYRRRRNSLALRLTCQQIAGETNGVALKVNHLYFFTGDADKEEFLFECTLDMMLEDLGNLLQKMLNSLRCLMTPEVIVKVHEKYPVAVKTMPRQLRSENMPAPNIHAIKFALETIRTFYPQKFKELGRVMGENGPINTDEIMALDYKPWSPPSMATIQHLFNGMKTYYPAKPLSYVQEKAAKPQAESVSTATATVEFLRNLPKATRLEVRHLVHIEEVEKEGKTSNRLRGFIAFIIENDEAFLERRVFLFHAPLESCDAPWSVNIDTVCRQIGSWFQELYGLLDIPTKPTESASPDQLAKRCTTRLTIIDDSGFNRGPTLFKDIMKQKPSFADTYRTTYNIQGDNWPDDWEMILHFYQSRSEFHQHISRRVAGQGIMIMRCAFDSLKPNDDKDFYHRRRYAGIEEPGWNPPTDLDYSVEMIEGLERQDNGDPVGTAPHANAAHVPENPESSDVSDVSDVSEDSEVTRSSTVAQPPSDDGDDDDSDGDPSDGGSSDGDQSDKDEEDESSDEEREDYDDDDYYDEEENPGADMNLPDGYDQLGVSDISRYY